MFTELSAWDIIFRVALAIFSGGVIGFEREHKNKSAGLRTHILVCLGASIVAIIECMNAFTVLGLEDSGTSVSLGRLSAQVISGIGFLGAGTIVNNKRNIAGLTTAASLWNVGCLGLAAGMGYYAICLVGAGSTLIVLTVIKSLIVVHVSKQVEVTFIHRVETIEFINAYFEEHHIKVLDVDFTMEQQGDVSQYTNVYTLEMPHKVPYVTVISDLSEHANIYRVHTMEV